MRGPRLAAAATFLACLLVAGSCQPPGWPGAGEQRPPAAVVAWWSAERSPVPSFAASEVARYLSRMSGARVVAAAARLGGAPPERAAAALVVLTGRAAPRSGAVVLDARWTAGLAGALGGAAGDAFAAGSVDGDKAVMVAADARGVLYAGYDYLERLGVRFFAPDFGAYAGHAETVPRRSLSVPDYRTAQEAGLPDRVKDLDEGWSVSAATLGPLVDWMGKARLDVLAVPADLDLAGVSSYDAWRARLGPLVAERGIVVEVGQHGYENWLPRVRNAQFYAAGYTVFDVADDRAVAAYVEAVVAYLVARPEIGVFDAWPPDSATWPPAVLRRFGSVSNAHAYLVGRLTAALTARLPAVRVETIAYQDTQEPPARPYAYDPRRNIVDVAMTGRTYGQAMSGPANAPAAALLQRWRLAFGGEVGAYEYYRKYAFRSLPFPLPDVIGADVPWYRQAGVARIRTYAEPGDWITYELTHLEVAALAWDPGRDAGQLVARYLGERFGPAADAVGRYLRDAETASTAEFGFGADQGRLDGAVAAYGAAAADLDRAAEAADPAGAAAFLVDRLRWNADFALADARLTASVAGGDVVTALQLRSTGAALLAEHRLDGILVDNPRYALQYGSLPLSALDYAREYRGGAASVDPAGTVTLAPGATAHVRLTARAADAAARAVTWSATAASGVSLSPASGALAVKPGGSATATITITAGRDEGRVHVTVRSGSGSDAWPATGLDVVVARAGNLAPYRDSVAVTADGAAVGAGLDAQGCGYSQQALGAAGITPGGKLGVDGLTVTWPEAGGRPDNVVARGQQVTLAPGTRGSRLLLLAAAAPGDMRGAGWVTYADASRAYYQVHVPAWTARDGQTLIAAQSAYRACATPAPGAAYVYAIEVPLDRTREVTSVVLPTGFGGSALHVFQLAVG